MLPMPAKRKETNSRRKFADVSVAFKLLNITYSLANLETLLFAKRLNLKTFQEFRYRELKSFFAFIVLVNSEGRCSQFLITHGRLMEKL